VPALLPDEPELPVLLLEVLVLPLPEPEPLPPEAELLESVLEALLELEDELLPLEAEPLELVLEALLELEDEPLPLEAELLEAMLEPLLPLETLAEAPVVSLVPVVGAVAPPQPKKLADASAARTTRFNRFISTSQPAGASRRRRLVVKATRRPTPPFRS